MVRPLEAKMIRALGWLLVGLFSIGAAYSQDNIVWAPDNITRFDEAQISKQQKADILRVTGDQSEQEEIPGKPFIQILRLSTAKTKPPQIVAWRGTGGMGNKDIWIFQQVGNRAVLILQNAGGSMYGRLHSVHHGMHDFITFWKIGGEAGGNEVYAFDGKQYRPAYCFDTDSGGKDGPHHPCDQQ
jgi:hypothetical protein